MHFDGKNQAESEFEKIQMLAGKDAQKISEKLFKNLLSLVHAAILLKKPHYFC